MDTPTTAIAWGCSSTKKNFSKSSMVEPIGGGAYRHAPGDGWAVVVDGVG
jgi:hypothetical protein